MIKGETVDAWFELAEDAKAAAELLTLQHPRSFVSRMYYAMFAHAHAMLLQQGQRPRSGLGTWSHAALPLMVRKHLSTRNNSMKAHTQSQALRRARQFREMADYRPGIEVDHVTALALLKTAQQFFGGQQNE